MKVYNHDKTEILTDYDLEKGYLKEDRLFIKHHKAVKAVAEQGHYETIKEYPNGGKDVEWIVDIPGTEAKGAYDEYEDIQVYIPYTEAELEKMSQQKYENTVDTLIRERYTLSNELAILRQRDSKPDEFAEYNAFVEECKAKAKVA